MIESFSLICVTASAAALTRSFGRCGEKTRKFRILTETTIIVIMDTHDNKAVCLVQPGSFHKKEGFGSYGAHYGFR